MFNKKYKNDILLVAIILLISVVIFTIFKANQKNGELVKVIVDKEVKYCYNFNERTEVIISNDDFVNVLVVEDGQAYIKSANCPDKICVQHRPISKVGETIVCLPHKVVIEITEE